MTHTDWNPHTYLAFHNERTQPSIDLVSKININHPRRIVDIGCGPGNSTLILAQRWPDAAIIGIDSSPAMIEMAHSDYPEGDWRLLDAGKDDLPGECDIVYSNATIQWIPDHPLLLSKFRRMLNDRGTLAVQVPQFFNMPLGVLIENISHDDRFAAATAGVRDLFTIHSPVEYYDMLAPLFGKVSLWQTDYIHCMDSAESILAMIRSTGLKPYLDRLANDAQRGVFEELVLDGIRREYPVQQNGKVLFPFKRLFFVATFKN